MPKIHKVFQCAVHEDYGMKGWKLKSVSHFEPLEGMAVAHDVMEHFHDDTPTIDSEAQALGAAALVRATYFANKQRNIEDNLMADWPNLFHLWQNETYPLNPPPKVRRPNADTYIEGILTNMETAAVLFLLGECCDNEDTPENREKCTTFRDRFIPWMLVGYLRARERYRGHSTAALSELFTHIEESANNYLKRAEEHFSELTVELSIGHLDARIYCEEVYPH